MLSNENVDYRKPRLHELSIHGFYWVANATIGDTVLPF